MEVEITWRRVDSKTAIMKEEVIIIRKPVVILVGSKPVIACAGCCNALMPSSISTVPSATVRRQTARTNHLGQGFLDVG